MIKREKGITLISLIITIALMVIISSTVIYISFDRFEINNLRKMMNDIELLQDKVSSYYLKYGGLPILRNIAGTGIRYSYTALDFVKNNGDNENYYILDLSAMEGISLNYGKEGYEQPNTSKDVYVINELTHIIYYVEGIKVEGKKYHFIEGTDGVGDQNKDGILQDNVPPTKPQIKVVSGNEKDGVYTSAVQVEIISGSDNWSGVKATEGTINGESYTQTTNREIYTFLESGKYSISAATYDNAGNGSQIILLTITIAINHTWDEGVITLAATCTTRGRITYTCTDSDCDVSMWKSFSELGHDYKVTKRVSATCTNEGTITSVCNRCGDENTERIAAVGHSYQSQVTKVATCTEEGVKTYKCKNCTYSYTEEIAAKGHDMVYDPWVEPTCTEEGHRSVRCKNCQDMFLPETKPALGHNEKFSYQMATSNWSHIKRVYCGRCEELLSEKSEPCQEILNSGYCICGRHVQ